MAKEKKGKQPAGDLQRIITEGRERKKIQDTADKIFGKRAAGGKKIGSGGGLLLSRAGVSKQKTGSSKPSAKPNSLAARATGRGAIVTPTGPRADMRATRNAQGIADALFSSKPNSAKVAKVAKAQVNVVPNKQNTNGKGTARDGATQFAGAAARAGVQQQAPPTGGITIKGLAGPHVVEVRGFAPGTTAADIEEALRGKGISVHSCRILQSSPKVIVDILCDSKEDADRIGEFHQQWTDYDARTGKGFQLFVFAPRPASTPTTPKPQPSRNTGVVVDGSMGFEPLPVAYDNGDSGLYSDQLMQTNQNGSHQSGNHQSGNHQNGHHPNGSHQHNSQNNNRRVRGNRGGRGGNNR
ncbi:unnamed protein product [Discula destructiva]